MLAIVHFKHIGVWNGECIIECKDLISNLISDCKAILHKISTQTPSVEIEVRFKLYGHLARKSTKFLSVKKHRICSYTSS